MVTATERWDYRDFRGFRRNPCHQLCRCHLRMNTDRCLQVLNDEISGNSTFGHFGKRYLMLTCYIVESGQWQALPANINHRISCCKVFNCTLGEDRQSFNTFCVSTHILNRFI